MKRAAKHAGSWYVDGKSELNKQLQGFLDTATLRDLEADKIFVKGLIGPHAGYSYCGKTGAYAYKPVISKKQNFKRVLVLGPSHHKYLIGCAYSSAEILEIPLGNLNVDMKTLKSLSDQHPTIFHGDLTLDEDEDEHSLEMHYPWIAKSFDTNVIRVIPLMVGRVNVEYAKKFAGVMQGFMDDDETFIVISSDFCHWGKRFDFTYYDDTKGAIHSSIKHLDHLGMQAIETMKTKPFLDYMQKYENTICGRNPIHLLLSMLENNQNKKFFNLKFIDYSQSSACETKKDSSVSYAAGILFKEINK